MNVNYALFIISSLKNYLNVAEIFVLMLFKMVENQTEFFMLEQRSVIKSLMAKAFKQVKFIEECVMYSKKFVLVNKKMNANKLKMG